jgi:hypothetical protein
MNTTTNGSRDVDKRIDPETRYATTQQTILRDCVTRTDAQLILGPAAF